VNHGTLKALACTTLCEPPEADQLISCIGGNFLGRTRPLNRGTHFPVFFSFNHKLTSIFSSFISSSNNPLTICQHRTFQQSSGSQPSYISTTPNTCFTHAVASPGLSRLTSTVIFQTPFISKRTRIEYVSTARTRIEYAPIAILPVSHIGIFSHYSAARHLASFRLSRHPKSPALNIANTERQWKSPRLSIRISSSRDQRDFYVFLRCKSSI
jgi:hypothetical protein